MVRAGQGVRSAVSMIERLVVFTALLAIASESARGAAPGPLLEVLAANNCLDLSDDARVTRFGDQWWISLESSTGSESDFALYCQDKGEEVFARLILVVRGERNPWRECDAVVDSWRRSLPFRFHIDIEVTVAERLSDLGQWWLVSSPLDQPVIYGTGGRKVSGPLIDATNPVSGAGAMYACHSGEWYRIGLD